ncbi:ALP1-like protein [Tanacetum coccineum]
MKCTSAIPQMAYGAVPDAPDKYLQMGATTARKCLQMFCKAIMELYGEEFLRKLTYTDMKKTLCLSRGKAWGDHGPDLLILLEAIASNDLWIWHAFFGVSGMNNDVNVLRQSPLFNDLKAGKALDVPFVANNVSYKRGYYLTDRIYLKWRMDNQTTPSSYNQDFLTSPETRAFLRDSDKVLQHNSQWVSSNIQLVGENCNCGLHLNVDKTEAFWPKEDPRSGFEGVFPPNITRPFHGVKLPSGPVSVDFDFSSECVMKRVSKTIGLMDAIAKINDPQCELLLLCACTGISKLYFAMRTYPPRVFESAQLSFDVAIRSALGRIVNASGPGRLAMETRHLTLFIWGAWRLFIR